MRNEAEMTEEVRELKDWLSKHGDHIHITTTPGKFMRLIASIETAEARNKDLEAMVEAHKRAAQDVSLRTYDGLYQRAEAAEARVKELEAALERIQEYSAYCADLSCQALAQSPEPQAPKDPE